MLTITATTASTLTFVYVFLTFKVISLRRTEKVSLGDGGLDKLQAAVRAHGNFSEYVPLSLGLMALLEFDHFSPWILMLVALALVLGRVIHAVSVLSSPQRFKLRVLGMQLTFATLVSLALFNLFPLWKLAMGS
jgi:uncharacterized protein